MEEVIDTEDTAAIVESLVTRGDISGLTPEQKTQYYTAMCRSLGLNPKSQPFQFLKLSGKETMYATRAATDQLAKIHNLNREIIDGPKVVDLAGVKLVYAVCKVTHPSGRVETAVATVPLSDPQNVLMKAETKAKRRATLSILGMGMLDEAELDTVPGVVVQRAPAFVPPKVEPKQLGSPVDTIRAELEAARSFKEYVAVGDRVAALDDDHLLDGIAAYKAAWEKRAKSVTDLGSLDLVRKQWAKVHPEVREALGESMNTTFANVIAEIAPQTEPGEAG